jgi:hypothetical protein
LNETDENDGAADFIVAVIPRGQEDEYRSFKKTLTRKELMVNPYDDSPGYEPSMVFALLISLARPFRTDMLAQVASQEEFPKQLPPGYPELYKEV